jgi:ABC-type Zn uptake system ZnuABC Zn-binding protein ZnuA
LDDFLEPVMRNTARHDLVHVVASVGLQTVLATAAPTANDGMAPAGGQARQVPIGGPGPSGGADSEVAGPGADPHFWQNPLYTVHYVTRIRDGLARVDPPHAGAYQGNWKAYTTELQRLDEEIAVALEEVPPPRRHLVSYHDAFGHLAQRYGWRTSAFVPSDASAVSPSTMVRVLEDLRREGIPVVFAEPQFRADALLQAASDAGVAVKTIYSDSLDFRVTTYLEMMRFNLQSLLTLRN